MLLPGHILGEYSKRRCVKNSLFIGLEFLGSEDANECMCVLLLLLLLLFRLPKAFYNNIG